MTTTVLDRPALEQPTSQRPSIEGAQFLPLTLCEPSPFNPRKRFNQARLEDLANSIEKVGVLQPTLMRPKPGAKRGGPQYQIVAGERRWRACKILAERLGQLGVAVIPAIVRDISDFEALELAAVENVQREDVHPIEEAEGYEALLLKPLAGGEFNPPRLRGYTADEIALRVGKSRSYVFGRLNLCKLIPAAREACFEDKISASIALLISRMPVALQPDALEKIVAGWGGEPYSYRQASEYLHRTFMLTLGGAIFDTTDASLVSVAGACTACPKRTGANPDLFNDVKSADTCTDPACFDAKQKAHAQRSIDQARAKGITVLEGEAVEKIMPYGEYSLAQNGYLRTDKAHEDLTGSKKHLLALIGDDFKGATLLLTDGRDLPVPVAKVTDVKAALKAKGLYKPTEKSGPVLEKTKPKTAESIRAKRAERIDEMLARRLPAAIVQHVTDEYDQLVPTTTAWLRALIKPLYDTTDADTQALQVAVCGRAEAGGAHGAWIEDLDDEHLSLLLITLVLCSSTANEYVQYGEATLPESTNELAAAIKFDMQDMRDEVAEEVDAAIADEVKELLAEPAETGKKAKPLAKKPAAKKAKAAPTTTPIEALADADAEARQKVGDSELDALEAKGWPFPGTTA